MSKQKKQSFLGGAAILAAAVVVVKIIGAAYKLPLNNILGEVGMSYWDTAYKIYNFLLTFSTAGLPLAISKLTSEAHTQGRENAEDLPHGHLAVLRAGAGGIAADVFSGGSLCRLPAE